VKAAGFLASLRSDMARNKRETVAVAAVAAGGAHSKSTGVHHGDDEDDEDDDRDGGEGGAWAQNGVSDRLAAMLASCLASCRSHASWRVRLAVVGACDLLQVRHGEKR